MSEIFWEETRKARKEHFCHFCCNRIEPGQIYSRYIWAPRGRSSFHVMNRHDEPMCPPNIGEELHMEMVRAERAALGVPIAFEIRSKEVVIMQRDGSTITRSEPEVVPVVISATILRRIVSDRDEEIPF